MRRPRAPIDCATKYPRRSLWQGSSWIFFASDRKESVGHFHGDLAFFEVISQRLRKLAGLLGTEQRLRAQYDAVVQLLRFVNELVETFFAEDFGQPIHIEIQRVMKIAREGEILPLFNHRLQQIRLLLCGEAQTDLIELAPEPR